MENIDLKCVACLGEDQEMKNIFDKVDGNKQLSLAALMENCLLYETLFSSNMCKKCAQTIVNFYNFKIIFGENQRYFKSLLEKVETEQKRLKDIETESMVDKSPDESAEIDIYKPEILSDDDLKSEPILSDQSDSENQSVEQNEEDICLKTDLPEENMTATNSCKYCGAIFSGKLGLSKHVKNMHSEGSNTDEVKYDSEDGHSERSFVCLLCNARFKKQKYLYEHKVVHNPERNFKCPVCKKMFKTNRILNRHKKVIHKLVVARRSAQTDDNFKFKEIVMGDSEKVFLCLLCNATFKQKKYILDHRIVHMTERKFKCPMCDKSFKTNRILNRHKKSHNNALEYICEQCGKSFNYKNVLKTHIQLVHVRDRNYMCFICGLKFPLKSTLDKHIKRHNRSPDETFDCSNCEMRYKNKSSLKRHFDIVHKGMKRVFQCEICLRGYGAKSQLDRHKTQKHHKAAVENITFKV